MNPSLICLSQHNPSRYVACCREGLIQLAWDDLTIHLRPANFARLIGLLETGIVELYLLESREGRSCCLKQIELGRFQLRVGRLSLDLTLLDFLALAEMARTAARQLALTAPPAPAGVTTIRLA